MTLAKEQLDDFEQRAATVPWINASELLQLVAIARAAMAWSEAERDRYDAVVLMQRATNSGEYNAACALMPRICEKRDAAISALNSALWGKP